MAEPTSVGRTGSAGALPPAIPTEEQAVWDALLKLDLPKTQTELLFFRYQDLLGQSKDKAGTRENTLSGLSSADETEHDPIKWVKENFYGDWDKKETPCPTLNPLTPEQKAGRKMFGDSYDDLEKDYLARRKTLEDSSDWKDIKRLEDLDRNYATALSSGKPKDVKRALSSVPLKDDSGATVPVPTVELTPEAEEKKGSWWGKTKEGVDKFQEGTNALSSLVNSGKTLKDIFTKKKPENPDPSTDSGKDEEGGAFSRILDAIKTRMNALIQGFIAARTAAREDERSHAHRNADLADPTKREERQKTRAEARTLKRKTEAETDLTSAQTRETEERTKYKTIKDMYKTREQV